MVLDNQTANINIGKDVPRITNTTINSLGNAVNSVTYESIGIILNVTPHINPDGLVTMIVAPEISDVASAAESVQITRGRALADVQREPGADDGRGAQRHHDRHRRPDPRVARRHGPEGPHPRATSRCSATSSRARRSGGQARADDLPDALRGVHRDAELEEITQLEKSRLKIMDLRDIEAESDRWLERIRK